MILRSQGVVFVHIPKNGGTSLERALGFRDRHVDDPPNYELGWGWCPDRQRWLQHLTLDEMVDFGLLSLDEFESFFKFAIVRNPYARLLSDYRFLRNENAGLGTFNGLLERKGSFSSILNYPDIKDYRGDHVRPQLDYVTRNGVIAVDHLGRLESLDATVDLLRNDVGLHVEPVPHEKQARSYFQHYSHFFSDNERDRTATLYSCDLSAFDYDFDDRRSRRTSAARQILRPLESGAAIAAAVRHRTIARRVAHRLWRFVTAT
jgi:hypothetical protein